MEGILRARRASILALACLSLAPAVSADGPFRLVVGYTQSAIQEVYLEDGKRVAKTMVGRYLETVDPELQADLLIFDGPAELAEAIRGRRIDLVGFAPNQLVEISREVALDPVFVTESKSGIYEDAVLLVRTDSGFERLADLKGKRLMTLVGAEGGHHELWLDTWALRDAGVPMRSLFGVVGTGRTSSQTILACFFSSADACLVPGGAFNLARELNPQVGHKLRALGSSTGILGAVLAFRPDCDPRLKALVIPLLARAHQDPLGRQILTLFRQTRLAAFRPEYLEGIQALVREHASRLKAFRAAQGAP